MTTPEANTQTIRLASLVINDAFQIRLKPDKATVERYRQCYKAEVPMPPIKVALVDGAPVLVDGFHRVEAMRRVGIISTEALVAEATRTEARWMAAEANLAHGLPLKPSEVRRVFKAYVRARKHYAGKGKLKSYRTIAQDIGRHFTTIRAWMLEDFPKIAEQYSGEQPGHAEGGLKEKQKASFREITTARLVEAVAASRGILSPQERAEVIREFQEATKAVAEGGPWTPEEEDF